MTTRPDRPVKIPWDKRETPPNAAEEAEDGVAVSVLLLALSITSDGVVPSSMSQENQFSEF
jgi:hypothetical protein